MFRVEGGCIHRTGIEHNRKLKFSMQTNLTHINTIFKYFLPSVILDIVDVLYLEGKNVLKNRTATVFFYSILVSRPVSLSDRMHYYDLIYQIMTDLSGLSQTWKKLTKLISLDKSQLFQAILNLLSQIEFSVALECSYLYEIYMHYYNVFS